MNIKVGKEAIAEASKKLSNWGRWGKTDQIGTLNHVTPEHIVKAASLIKTGKVFALGIPLDRDGPQNSHVVSYDNIYVYFKKWNTHNPAIKAYRDRLLNGQTIKIVFKSIPTPVFWRCVAARFKSQT